MRIDSRITAAVFVAIVWASPTLAEDDETARGYWGDGVGWQEYDNNVKSVYLMGAWDGYMQKLVRNWFPSSADYMLIKCANRKKYNSTNLVTIVDNYYKKTNDLKAAPAEVLFKEMHDLCINKE